MEAKRNLMETILTSRQRQVRIGPGLPFVIIGERINPTGRKLLAAEMAAADFERVRNDAIAQVAAGAAMLDVNAGIPLADEPGILARAIREVQSVVDVPLSIDSSVIAALEAGLAAYQGKALVNSVTGEESRLQAVLPLVRKYGAAVIGVSNDESGISEDPQARFEVAVRIVERAEAMGIPRQDVLIDPLAMPVSAVPNAGKAVFELIRRLQEELGVNTVCGASNISFGLPGRPAINAAFLAMVIGAGMPCAITNPLEATMRQAIMAADVLMGRDPNCQAWLGSHRQASGDRASDREARRQRRRRRQNN
jgi:5-methyltetrahydrofolate--homocysteine methyltransferase